MPEDGKVETGSASSTARAEPSLFPARITTRYPANPIGKDYAFLCEAGSEGTFHCKRDTFNKPVRGNEWFSQSLTQHLGIPVPEFRIVEDTNGETYFGSREIISTAHQIDVVRFLNYEQLDEIGRAAEWLGRRLSGLTAVDLFLSNPDRTMQNFVFVSKGATRQLCPIDFADVDLKDITSERFPIVGTNTMRHGRFLRSKHGFVVESALEMIDRIEAIPHGLIDGILRGMPDDWMASDQRNNIVDAWSGKKIAARLSALRAGISDESLL
ncbi:MAG TPA: HipA family kinase [Sphingopyxis sp.]|nr:HipA family kinase [Sphingopyxis sp.]